MDSTFLGSLVYVLKRLKSINGEMKLIFKKQSKASTMFEITNMNKVFQIHPSVEDALVGLF